MRLKEGQLWIHRDSDETVDKILRVDKAHCYSNVAKCWTENSHGVCVVMQITAPKSCLPTHVGSLRNLGQCLTHFACTILSLAQ